MAKYRCGTGKENPKLNNNHFRYTHRVSHTEYWDYNKIRLIVGCCKQSDVVRICIHSDGALTNGTALSDYSWSGQGGQISNVTDNSFTFSTVSTTDSNWASYPITLFVFGDETEVDYFPNQSVAAKTFTCKRRPRLIFSILPRSYSGEFSGAAVYSDGTYTHGETYNINRSDVMQGKISNVTDTSFDWMGCQSTSGTWPKATYDILVIY